VIKSFNLVTPPTLTTAEDKFEDFNLALANKLTDTPDTVATYPKSACTLTSFSLVASWKK
jgi:hypothetical protein